MGFPARSYQEMKVFVVLLVLVAAAYCYTDSGSNEPDSDSPAEWGRKWLKNAKEKARKKLEEAKKLKEKIKKKIEEKRKWLENKIKHYTTTSSNHGKSFPNS